MQNDLGGIDKSGYNINGAISTGLPPLQEQRDKCVYEVDPLRCPNCEETVNVISFVTSVL